MASAIPLTLAIKIAVIQTKPACAGSLFMSGVINNGDHIISLIHGNELLYS
jgi:hypothetical protein